MKKAKSAKVKKMAKVKADFLKKDEKQDKSLMGKMLKKGCK